MDVKTTEARGFFARARGLIGRPPPPPGTGLLIPKCNCIHTLFMSYPIDATFLDAAGRPVKTLRNVRPWRLFAWGGWRARAVVETAAQETPRRGAAKCGQAMLECVFVFVALMAVVWAATAFLHASRRAAVRTATLLSSDNA